jgi:ubiquinol-cytochrome c reductase cytochrome c1 subunit
MKIIFGVLLLLLQAAAVAAAETPLQEADIDIFDRDSLRRGAGHFVTYCQGCHGLKQIRYSRIAKDLHMTEEAVRSNLMSAGAKIHDSLTTAMDPKDGERWFGVAPPDLSLVARAKGADWVYTYLKTFYVDPSRPFGVNNLVYDKVAMPHVLWELQGLQRPVMGREEDTPVIKRLDRFKEGALQPEEFDRWITDLVNFMGYVAEPSKLERLPLGKYVIAFLAAFLVIIYKLKKQYWKDVR